MVKLVAQQTADTLSIKQWGRTTFEKNYGYIIVRSPYIPFENVTDIYLYDNNNILIKIFDDRTKCTKYRLLCSNGFSLQYDSISLENYDDKYRIAYANGDVTILLEKTGKNLFPDVKWKAIKGIYQDIAIVNSRSNLYNLVRLNYGTNYSNELQGSSEIVHIADSLFKYRTPETRGLYFLYNAANRKSSIKSRGYNTILYVSDQLAMGIIAEGQWDFIDVHSVKSEKLEVICSSFKEPDLSGDTIEIVDYDENDGEEKRYTINKSGTCLLDEDKKEIIHEDISSINESIERNDEKVKQISSRINIGRFIIVNDNSVRESENGPYLFVKKSFKKACKCEGFPCWILLKSKQIVITEKECRGNKTNSLYYLVKEPLPDEFNIYEKITDDRNWLYIDKTIIAPQEKIVQEAINEILLELKEKLKEQETAHETQQKIEIEDTKDVLRLKAIYDFLKLQGFDKSSIGKALSSLFPSVEKYIDFTNVKHDYYHRWKRYVENIKLLERISFDESNLIEELHLTENERVILDYYTKVKGYKLSTAIDYIYEESSTGEKVMKRYEELMRLGEMVANQKKMLQQTIIEDLVGNFAAMADTSEMLQQPEQLKEERLKYKEFEPDFSKSTNILIKDKTIKLNVNELIKYDVFESKKIHQYDKPVSYIHLGKNIIILLNKDKASEYDSEHTRQFLIRGCGEDKKFDQDFTAINEIIHKQRINGMRIYIFINDDGNSCRFFDEIQCIKSELVPDEEEKRKVIMFTMKSLIRYNTD